MGFASPALSRRLAGGSGALLLQGVFLLLLLYSTPKFTPTTQFEREMTLILPRLHKTPLPMKAAPLPMSVAPPQSTPNAGTSPLVLPPPTSLIPVIPPSAIQGFGQALNNCAPENYARLPEDQRAKCQRPGDGVAIQELPNLMGSPSHVTDEVHWQAELARKQSPTLLPCNGFLNVACFLGKIADGTWTDYGDPRTWPNYAVKQLQPEDLYKIEKEYDVWNRDHSPIAGPHVSPATGQAKN